MWIEQTLGYIIGNVPRNIDLFQPEMIVGRAYLVLYTMKIYLYIDVYGIYPLCI